MSNQIEQTLLWCDIETTGLNPDEDLILEICIRKAAFDKPFDTIEFYHTVLPIPKDKDIAEMNEWVRNTHTNSGLFDECLSKKYSTFSTFYVQEEILSLLGPEPEPTKDGNEKPILAGSTIHFDKSFIAHHMPEFHKRLSHRLYDVSAIKLFCHSLGMPRFVKGEAHRAKEDILESISHAKQCEDWLYNRPLKDNAIDGDMIHFRSY